MWYGFSLSRKIDGNKRKVKCMRYVRFCEEEKIVSELSPKVKSILLLDSEGKRIAAKYYSDDWSTNTAKKDFEKAVFSETQKTNALGAVQYGKIEPYRTWRKRHLDAIKMITKLIPTVTNKLFVCQGFSASRIIPLDPVRQRSTSPGRVLPGLNRTQYHFGVQKKQGSFRIGRESNPDGGCHYRPVLPLVLQN
ncbi:hypothetical protein YC2023_020004 [Brassica napus]